MKFSCIIGTYNPNNEWLVRAVNSADGLFDELIIVDDGSKTVVPQFYPWRQPIIQIKHDANKGFYEAKNTAIKNATGDIIATLDDDDYFNMDGVVKLKQFIEENPNHDVYHFLLQEFGLSSGVYGINADPKELTDRSSIPGISWYKRKLWEDLGGFRKVRAEDWNFFLRACRANKRFNYFPNIVYDMNVRLNSISRSWTIPFKQIRREVLDNV